jgi:hypothetical protein
MSGPEAILAFTVVSGTLWVLRPVATAIAKRIAGEHRRPEVDAEERDDLRAELQQVREELGELAERVDFAERLLAKQREGDPPRLGARRGGGGS